MALIKTVDELKNYITLDGSFNFDTLLPYIEPSEDDIKRLLGDAQYTELSDYYNSGASGITELDDLLPFVQRPVVYFAFLKGLDKFNVSIGNNGIGVIANQNLAPASKERVEKLRQSITDFGYDSLEYLLEFLEDNIDDYPLWESSDAYAYQFEYLISSARKFDELYRINRSRLTYLNWRPTMADMELLKIIPQVSVEYVDELKQEIKDDNVSANNQKVLTHLQKALAYLTAGTEEDDARYSTRGQHLLMMVKSMLDAAPDDYPTYKASSVYDETITSYQPYENEDDSNLGVFG